MRIEETKTRFTPKRGVRTICVLVGAALTLGMIGFTSLRWSARAATPVSQVPYRIIAGSGQDLLFLDEPSGASSTSHFDGLSHNSVAVWSSGSPLGFVDKGFDNGLTTHGQPDARLYEFDAKTGITSRSRLVGCNGVGGLTLSPDNHYLAGFCQTVALIFKGQPVYDNTSVVVFDVHDLSYSVVASLPVKYGRDLAWSPSGNALWIASTSGMFAWSGGQLHATTIAPTLSFDFGAVRVLPNGLAVGLTFDVNSNFLHVCNFNATSLAATCQPVFDNTPGNPPDRFHFIVGDAEYTFAAAPDGRTLEFVFGGSKQVGTLDLSGPAVVSIFDLALGVYKNPRLALDATGTQLVIQMRAPTAAAAEVLNLADNTVVNQVVTNDDQREQNTNNLPDVHGSRPFLTTPPPPVASFGVENQLAGAQTQFDASFSKSSPGTTIVEYHWHWGDGSSDTLTPSPTITHTFSAAGTYPVTLTVTDSLGQSGPGSGYWDGYHWVTRGAASAVTTTNLAVGTRTLLNFEVDDHGTGKRVFPGDRLPPGSSVDLKGLLTPDNQNYEAITEIQFTRDGADYGAPVRTGDNGTGRYAEMLNVPVGDPGPHQFSAYYNGSGLNMVQPAQADPVDVTVDKANTTVTASTPQADVSSGATVPVNAVLTGCAGGTYTAAVDGAEAATATPDPTTTSATMNLTGIADGTHQIKVSWAPDQANSPFCNPSESAPFTIRVGSGTPPTTTPPTTAPPTTTPPTTAPPTTTPPTTAPPTTTPPPTTAPPTTAPPTTSTTTPTPTPPTTAPPTTAPPTTTPPTTGPPTTSTTTPTPTTAPATGSSSSTATSTAVPSNQTAEGQLPSNQTAPAQSLASTGSDVLRLLALAGWLVVVGQLLLASIRRRRTDPSG